MQFLGVNVKVRLVFRIERLLFPQIDRSITKLMKNQFYILYVEITIWLSAYNFFTMYLKPTPQLPLAQLV